jgi:hypothetical protein
MNAETMALVEDRDESLCETVVKYGDKIQLLNLRTGHFVACHKG